MIHFDGWGPDYNYWCSREAIELHPAGWCAKHGWELQPPHSKCLYNGTATIKKKLFFFVSWLIEEQEWKNWSVYLKETHAERVPDELFNEVYKNIFL